MTDIDQQLRQLETLEIPPPSATAKQQAIKAALDADAQVESAADKKSEKKFQGVFGWPRLTSRTNTQERMTTMSDQQEHPRRKSRKPFLLAGTALASLLLVIGVQQGTEHLTGESNALQVRVESDAVTKSSRTDEYREILDTSANKAPAITSQIGPVATPAKKASKPMAGQSFKAPATEALMMQSAPAPTAVPMAMSRAMPIQEYGTQLYVGDDAFLPPQPEATNRDKFDDIKTNPVKTVKDEPVSTFSIDVDTSSYANVRRSLNNGRLPQKNAVRVEEMINYFEYDYPVPASKDQPFKPTVAVYPSPWNPANKLIHIGIKGHEIVQEKPPANLVFLLDVSGSMHSNDKLPLLKNAFRLMVENLQPADTVSIVTYAGNAGTVLEPTKVAEKAKILAALDQLRPGGSTAGAQGIKQAYALAKSSFKKDGVNRVMLATDGDFNVGITDREQLKQYIERQRDSGIFLSVLGFGQGNYNDALMQTLAQNGNGNAAYIDTLNEARKVLVEEASSTLYPIAKDVKIQVEFNPQRVAEYRLIGYENRMLRREDFNNDKIDAGEIGAGHTVTAIYEITPVGSDAALVDDLRYGDGNKEAKPTANPIANPTGEYAFLKMRYKLPDESKSQLLEQPITKQQALQSIDDASPDLRFAASVAGFGQVLRGGTYTGAFDYDAVIDLAKSARGDDPFGYRSEFLQLVRLAKSAQ